MIRKFLLSFLLITTIITTLSAISFPAEFKSSNINRILSESSIYTEEKEKEVTIKRNLFILLFLMLLTIWFLLLSRLKKDLKKNEDLLILVGRLLTEENCEELEEILVPVISFLKKDTFLIKSLADCYLKEGRFIEAAALYERISEIFRKSGFDVLSDSFKKRAEELLSREFRRG